MKQEPHMKIGFIGLGQMGAGMAANLVKAGHDVSVYNRSPEKTEPLIALGATHAATVAATADADFVFTMLADDKALTAVASGDSGLIAAMKPGAIHISCSTISVTHADSLTAAHETAGQHFVSAPVFGRPEAAAAAKLFIVACGVPAAITACQPLLDIIGQRTFVMGETPSTANLIKLSGNFLIASVIESLGEAMALVAKGGVDLPAYVDLLTSTLFAAPVYKTYAGLIAAGNFSPPGFAAPLGQKDIRLALAAAEDLQVPMPIASLLRDRFLALLANGGANLDWSALGKLAAKDSGQAGP
jgi:3-hydroxyisobutyrate dehydrogenase-like beta-hydroxyacid dehydrogenase